MGAGLLNEEMAANRMDAEDELLHVELGCRATHTSIGENFTWGGNPRQPEGRIVDRAIEALAPVCPRCQLKVLGWQWQPGRTLCAPANWAYCIRNDLAGVGRRAA